MISIEKLRYDYEDSSLSFSDWRLETGEKALILGKSGSGKTTLLHLICGFLKPKEGFVTVNDVKTNDLKPKTMDQFRGKNIGIVFQKPHYISALNLEDNLKAAQHLAGMKINKNRILEVTDRLSIQQLLKRKLHQLSQGQVQRFTIARAVLNKPAVLLADEPTSSLDDENAEAVLDLLVNETEEVNATLIISTHDNRVKTRVNKHLAL